MKTITEPLSNSELSHVAKILNRFSSEDAMNLEMMDGFFAALICDPGTTSPNTLFPEIWGGNEAVDDVFNYDQERQEFFDLIIRHWNSVEYDLQNGNGYWPVLLEDEDGNTHANDWATGYYRGCFFTSDSFKADMDEDDPLFQQKEISFLSTEHDPFFTFSNKSISSKEREELIHAAAVSIVLIYDHHAEKRQETHSHHVH